MKLSPKRCGWRVSILDNNILNYSFTKIYLYMNKLYRLLFKKKKKKNFIGFKVNGSRK